MWLLPSMTTNPPFPPPFHGSPPLVPITFAWLSIFLNTSQVLVISGTAPPSNDVYPPCLSPSYNSLQPLTAVHRNSLLWQCPELLFQSLLCSIMIMPPAGMYFEFNSFSSIPQWQLEHLPHCSDVEMANSIHIHHRCLLTIPCSH